jgi:porin
MHLIAISFGAFLSCLSLFAYAEDAREPDFEATTATGNWGGTRSSMAESGIFWDGILRLDAFRNRGGKATGSGGSVDFEVKMKMDFSRLAGWDGGSGMIHVLDNARTGVNACCTGSLMGVTNVEVPVPTSRLFQAWLQQSFLDDRFAVLAGLYPIDTEFFAMDSAGLFLGPQYGTPADLAVTRGPSIFNNAAFGVRAKWQTADHRFYGLGAILDGIPNDPAQPKRTAILFAKGDGAFGIAEVGWLPEATDEQFEGHAKAAFGVWRYTAQVDDLLDTDAVGNPVRRRSFGGYLLGERTLLRLGSEGGRYVSAFGRYTWTDGNSTQIANTINLGLHAHGLIPSRADDTAGIAWTRGNLSGKFRQAQLGAGIPVAGSEDALEVTYRIQATPWFAFQPVIERIRHPGGGGNIPTATLIGVRAEFAL